MTENTNKLFPANAGASIQPCRKRVLACAIVALLGLVNSAFPRSQEGALPKSHRHIGVSRSMVGDPIPEFSIDPVSLEAGVKKESVRTNRTRRLDAFTVSGTRLFVADRIAGEVLEIRGLPLEWRPFSDLIWANDRTLMFDRWSQPH